MTTPWLIDRRHAAATLAAAIVAPSPLAALSRPPLQARDILLSRDQPAIEIPGDYLGIHSDHGVSTATQPPSYPYDAVRSHDTHRADGHPMLQWGSIERAPGSYDWSSVDQWIAAHPGKTRTFVLFGTPRFYQKYPGEKFPYPSLPGGGSPPSDPRAAGAFIAALLARHPRTIRFIELWNEPNFGWAGSDPERDRWTMEKPGFFTGTASDLAALARAVRRVLPDGVKLLAGAWEGQDSNRTMINSMLRFSAAPDGAGGRGRDHVQALSVHAYTYNNDPNTLIKVLRNYHERHAEAGYPATMERFVTEIGAEAPGYWTATKPSAAEKARTVMRWCMIPAALGYKGAHLYKHSIMRTLGDPQRTPEIANAIRRARDGLAGKRVLEAAVLADETIWMAFADGTTLRA
jgi:hypothetical protein